MSRNVIAAGLAALIAFLPFQSGSEEPSKTKPEWVMLARCAAVVVYTFVGGVLIFYVKQYCDHAFSNANWRNTNELNDTWGGSIAGPLFSANSVETSATTTIQVSEGIGGAWIDDQHISLSQCNGIITGVLSKNGTPIATNSVPVDHDGQTVVLDFRPMICRGTNTPPIQMFRLVN